MIPDQYLYLAINIGVIIVPLLFSFHPKLQFINTWKAFSPALIISAAIFIIWDIIFTHLGVWSFNNRYVLGIYWAKLPIEEWLFFICIPYACMFTHFCIQKTEWHLPFPLVKAIRLLLIIVLIIISIDAHAKLYTAITFFMAAILLLTYPLLVKNAHKLGEFMISYSILILPFLITNGILTGTGLEEAVVQYNPLHILNIRVLTIPCEDFIYGMMLILINIMLFEKFRNKSQQSTTKIK
jgi:lycopene cyclase domain-containing protein